MPETKLMRRAKAPQEPSLPGQVPSAGTADFPTCHRSRVAELGCSMLPTDSRGFPPPVPRSPPLLQRLLRASCWQRGHQAAPGSTGRRGSSAGEQEPAPALASTAGCAVGSVLLLSAHDFFPLCEKLGWNKPLSTAHHGHGSDF